MPAFAAGFLPTKPRLGLPLFGDSGTDGCLGCSVILISIDTLRSDHLGCYGYSVQTSPHIDGFAEDAVLFRTAIAQSSSTVRSHASILTSLFDFQHRARRQPATPLPPEAVTLAEVLRSEGYQTAAFTAAGQMDPMYGHDQGFDLYDSQSQRRFAGTVADAIEWLEAEQRSKFFIFLHTYEVHAAYVPDQKYLDLLGPGEPSLLPTQISVELIDRLNFNFFGRGPTFTAADVRHVIRSYDAEIRSMDAALGRLVEYLRAQDEYDDLLVVFTADHGEEFGEHGVIGAHAHSLHDEILKVPLIVKFPGGMFASTRVNSQVRSIDIAPTIADVLSIPQPPSFEGVSLVDLITGRVKSIPFALSERGGKIPSVAIRTDRWKLYDGALYDLLADPMEREDVSRRYKSVTRALGMNLVELLARPMLGAAEEIVPSEEIIRQLRALGYIQ